jgi:hypothetical protein
MPGYSVVGHRVIDLSLAAVGLNRRELVTVIATLVYLKVIDLQTISSHIHTKVSAKIRLERILLSIKATLSNASREITPP